MAQYWMPLDGKPSTIAPSLVTYKRGVGTSNNSIPNGDGSTEQPTNPTVIPEALLKDFHFAFLIRHPRSSIPSYYRCTIPPLSAHTGFHDFRPAEAGYAELRRLFDYTRHAGLVGGGGGGVPICLVDADDMLDSPYATVQAFCDSVGMPYSPNMLKWDTDADRQHAAAAFAKWPGFHEDALDSTELRPRTHVSLFFIWLFFFSPLSLSSRTGKRASWHVA